MTRPNFKMSGVAWATDLNATGSLALIRREVNKHPFNYLSKF